MSDQKRPQSPILPKLNTTKATKPMLPNKGSLKSTKGTEHQTEAKSEEAKPVKAEIIESEEPAKTSTPSDAAEETISLAQPTEEDIRKAIEKSRNKPVAIKAPVIPAKSVTAKSAANQSKIDKTDKYFQPKLAVVCPPTTHKVPNPKPTPIPAPPQATTPSQQTSKISASPANPPKPPAIPNQTPSGEAPQVIRKAPPAIPPTAPARPKIQTRTATQPTQLSDSALSPSEKQPASVKSAADIEFSEKANTQPVQNPQNDIPEEWLEGKGNYLKKETSFSAPNLIPEPLDSHQNADSFPSKNNVDLEVHENLPPELASVIKEYDNEIQFNQTRDGIRECTIQLAIARILEYAGFEKLAYVRYLKALDANHFSRTAIHELRRIARAYNKTNDVVTLLQSEIDTDISPEEQAIFLEECALLTFFSDESRRTDAINMLYRAIALAPKYITPLCTLSYLLLFEKRYTECCNALEKMIALTDDREIQITCYCIKGDLESSINPKQSNGLDSYLRTLELSPGMLYAFQHAMSIFLRQKNWQTLYARTLAFAKDSKDKIVSHAAMILAGSIAVDLLSDFVGSTLAYEQALHFIPTDSMPLELQADNYSCDPSKWKEYDDVLDKLIKDSTVPKERAELILLRAINLDRNGKQTSKAIDVLKEITNTQPCDRLVLEYYYDLLKSEGRLPEVMQLTKKFIEMSSTDDAASRYASLGSYCYDVLKNFDEAEINFRNALALDPNQRTAFEYLDQILRARNDFEGVAQLYRARLDVTLDARTRASMLYSLAIISEYSLGQPENAIFYFNLYREIYPDDIHAIHSLERLYLRTKSWKDLIGILLVEKNSAPTLPERCALLVRVANICRYKLNKLDYAAAFLRQAKSEVPTSLQVYNELEEILMESRNWKELISILTEKLTLQKKTPDLIATLSKIAHIQRDYLCDNKEAIVCFEQILKLDPTNLMAATNLANIYKNTGNFAAYYELALERAQHISLPILKCKHLFRIALKTLTIFNEPEQAISILELARASVPNYTPAIFLLTLLYGANAQINELVSLLQEYTNTVKNQSTKSACAMTLSYLYTWMVNSPDDAIHPLELSLALSPDAMNARFMLIHSQYSRGLYHEIAALFTEGAQNTHDRVLAAHYYNLAAFFAHTFPQTAGAFDNEVSALKSAIDLDGDNIITNERLESMESCRANLVPFIEKRIRTASQEDKTELQLALVESMYPDMPQKAFALICDIIEANPTHLPALRVGANMAQKLNNTKLLCHFLAMQAPLLENIPMRIVAWSNAAKIARDQLNHNELACEYFKQAFMLAPQSMEICDQLLDLLKKTHNIAAIDSLLQLHTRSISKENQVLRYAQMADDYLNEFNEPSQAVVKLRQILEIQPDNVDILWKLVQIEISLQHWNEARNALEILLENKNINEQLQLDVRLSLAGIYIEQLNNARAAIPLLQDALSSSPDNIQAIEQMANLYLQESRFSEALALLLRLNNILPPPQNIRALLQIANIYQTLNETEKLTQLMREAASLVCIQPSVLYDIQPWISRSKDPIVLRAFIEKLLEKQDYPTEIMVDIYEFVAFCYAGPLHMRFEADKYAIAAANIVPNSLRAQLLAAKVFAPKEAMIHATAAAKLSPLSIEPYQAMLQIAINSNRLDLQSRVEQQLVVLNAPIQPTESLQETFTSRYPDRPGIIDDNILFSAAPYEINRNIVDLLRLAGGKAQIFDVPEPVSEPMTSQPALQAIFTQMASVFDVNCTAHIVFDPPFLYAASPTVPDAILFNSKMLLNSSEPEARFHIASALTHYKLGTLPLVTLPTENITMLISGLLGLYDEKLTTPNVLSRIKSFLPRNLRKNVVELINSRGIAAFQYDPQQLLYATNQLVLIIGHTCCANLIASVSAIIRAKNPSITLAQTPQKWTSHYTNTPYLAELLAFNTSEQFSDLRQKLGIFIKMNS